MFSIALQRKIEVQSFKSYPLQFPLKDPSYFTCDTPTMLKEKSKMHEEDAHDDNLIATEASKQIHTRAQLHAAENAGNSHILETGDLNNNANSPLDVRNDTPALLQTMHAKTLHFCRRFCRRTPLLETILPPRAHPLHTTKMTSIYMQILPIIANSRSQKHWHVILSKLAYQNTTPQTNWYQRERCALLESRPRKSHRRNLF